MAARLAFLLKKGMAAYELADAAPVTESGAVQVAIMSMRRARPSVGCCCLAETRTWYLAVWFVLRVFSRLEVTLP